MILNSASKQDVRKFKFYKSEYNYINLIWYTYDFTQFSENNCCFFFSYYNSDFSTYSDDYKEFLANFFLAQIDSFEHGINHLFFNDTSSDAL